MTQLILITAAALLFYGPQAAPHQSLWAHPLIVDLVHSRPATTDREHDLPTLSRRLVSEIRDGPWASLMENELESRLQAVPLLTGNDKRHQVRCGATLCEVAIVSAPDESDEAFRKNAFNAFTRLADRELGLDHRTSAFLTAEEAPREWSMLAFFARGDVLGPY